MPVSIQDTGLITLIMLPGLDGTGRLFEPLVRELPGWVKPVVMSYPPDLDLSYKELVSYVAARIPEDRPLVILAESFSGPVAISLAVSGRLQISGVILCSTFSQSPWPFLMRLFTMLPLSAIFGFWFPKSFAHMALLGRDAPDSMAEELMSAVKSVRPSVLAQRLREVAKVDLYSHLKEIAVPVCVIKGARDILVPDEALRAPEGAELHIIDGPHMLLQARAGEAAAIITDFIKRITPHEGRMKPL